MKIHFTDDTRLNLPLLRERRHSVDDIVIPRFSLNQDELSHKESVSSIKSHNNSIAAHNLIDERSIVVLNKQTKIDKSKLAISIAIGAGTGIAMMPIFNEEVYNLDDYGIHVHGSEALFIVSTINTLLAVGISVSKDMYDSMVKNNIAILDEKQKYLWAAKVAAVTSSLIPISMLWNVELEDRTLSDSSGMDRFLAWAIVGTIALLLSKTEATYSKLEKMICDDSDKIELDSIGSKLVTYGISAIAAIARGISYSAVTEDLLKKVGVDDETAKFLGISIGGVLMNLVSVAREYSSLKKLFKKNNSEFTRIDLLKGVITFVEGVWFSLPTVTSGLNYAKSWNPLLKGMLFAPYFVSKSVNEASNVYKTFSKKEPNINIAV